MVLETGRYFQNVSCRRHAHRQDLENGVENPDLPAHVDKRGHDPGISYISVGDLAKAFYHRLRLQVVKDTYLTGDHENILYENTAWYTVGLNRLPM